jgi:putative ABC transport system permease protein
MGIRKVFGATVRSLMPDMNKYFAPLFVIAFVIAIPLSLWGIQQWLMNFAYRIEVLYSDFVIIFLILLLLASSPISLQSIKFAIQNPKNVLGEE